MMQTMKTLIIIPAYNEEASLPGVIRDLRASVPSADILVVDDGSRDGTVSLAQGLGVKVLTLPYNLGIGGAMQAGYTYAERGHYDIAVQFDGDGQHIAGEIPKILGPIAAGDTDIVVGSRFLGMGAYKSPLFRKMGIWVFSTILSRILGMAVTDSTSGFRAVNRTVIRFFSRMYPDDYPEVEALVLLHKEGMRITEVPVVMQGRTGGASSITPGRSAYYMIKVLLAIFIDLLKR